MAAPPGGGGNAPSQGELQFREARIEIGITAHGKREEPFNHQHHPNATTEVELQYRQYLDGAWTAWKPITRRGR